MSLTEIAAAKFARDTDTDASESCRPAGSHPLPREAMEPSMAAPDGRGFRSVRFGHPFAVD